MCTKIDSPYFPWFFLGVFSKHEGKRLLFATKLRNICQKSAFFWQFLTKKGVFFGMSEKKKQKTDKNGALKRTIISRKLKICKNWFPVEFILDVVNSHGMCWGIIWTTSVSILGDSGVSVDFSVKNVQQIFGKRFSKLFTVLTKIGYFLQKKSLFGTK